MSSSEEEEELLLHVEFNGMLDKNLLENATICKITGIDRQRPVMQIGNQTFAGEYKDIVGTALFFEEDESSTAGDPVFTKTPEHQLRYVCKTRKTLYMSRVFLKKKFKQEKQNPRASEDSESELEHEARIREQQNSASSESQTLPVISESFEPVAGPSWAPDVPYCGTIPPFKS